MHNIESYQPQYVTRFTALEERCKCLFCTSTDKPDPIITLSWKNEERQSLFLGCETACREVLLNPDAFILETANRQSDSSDELGEWERELNQLIINFVINPYLSLEQSLYAISVFLLRAEEEYSNMDYEGALERIKQFAARFISSVKDGVIQQQFMKLPEIGSIKSAALASLGKIPLSFSIPMAKKISFLLKLSELAIMPIIHLDERREKLMRILQEQTAPFFTQHEYILRNYILYQIYHNVFPYHNELDYEKSFKLLATDLFNVKILCSIWQMNENVLDEDTVVKLVSAYSYWRMNDKFNYNQLINMEESEDNNLLIGIALLL